MSLNRQQTDKQSIGLEKTPKDDQPPQTEVRLKEDQAPITNDNKDPKIELNENPIEQSNEEHDKYRCFISPFFLIYTNKKINANLIKRINLHDIIDTRRYISGYHKTPCGFIDIFCELLSASCDNCSILSNTFGCATAPIGYIFGYTCCCCFVSAHISIGHCGENHN